MCLYQLISKDIWCLTFVLRYNLYWHWSSPGGSCKKQPVTLNPWRKMKTTKGYFWGKNWSAVPPTGRGLGFRETPGPKPLGWEICEQRKLFFWGGKVGQNTLKGTSKVASGVLFIEAVVTVSLSWGVKVRKYCFFITWLNNTQLLNYYIHDFSMFPSFWKQTAEW